MGEEEILLLQGPLCHYLRDVAPGHMCSEKSPGKGDVCEIFLPYNPIFISTILVHKSGYGA